MFDTYRDFPRFASLFTGLESAFGTGAGRWVKRPPEPKDWIHHLQGQGPGIGIAPLRPDNTVMFAAIDLDEPDFDAAREMQAFLPGVSWLESSRSGNAHVWVFFKAPVAAWIPMGVMKEATLAAGKEHVEVFPKAHDFSRVKLGNYINLPFHGDSRPILGRHFPGEVSVPVPRWTLDRFLDDAHETANDPATWGKRADWLLITPPQRRESTQRFGEAQNLHICAQHIIETCHDHPVAPGHRAVVFFNLAKQLTNWALVDHDEALDLLRDVNSASGGDRIPDAELVRYLRNAEDKQYTSTGCDDPVFAPYAHPECRIAHPRR